MEGSSKARRADSRGCALASSFEFGIGRLRAFLPLFLLLLFSLSLRLFARSPSLLLPILRNARIVAKGTIAGHTRRRYMRLEKFAQTIWSFPLKIHCVLILCPASVCNSLHFYIFPNVFQVFKIFLTKCSPNFIVGQAQGQNKANGVHQEQIGAITVTWLRDKIYWINKMFRWIDKPCGHRWRKETFRWSTANTFDCSNDRAFCWLLQ